MTIRLSCPNCGKNIKAPASHAGKRALCPRCREEVFVPEAPADQDGDGQRRAEPGGVGNGNGSAGHPPASEGDLIPAAPQHEEEDLIDMTAMVDIVFFLLIFFMVTSMHTKQASISVPPAEKKTTGAAGGGPKLEDDTTTVRIEADNTVTVDDEDAPTKPELIQKLRDAGDTHMVVRVNGEAKHGTVIMVLDAGTDAGVDDVRLITETDADS